MSLLRMRIVMSSLSTISLWRLHLKWQTENHFTAKKRRIAISTTKKGKSTLIIMTDDEADGSDEADGESTLSKCMYFVQNYLCLPLNVVTAKKTHGSLGNPVDVDSDGLLIDVDVQPIDNIREAREDKRRNINKFFYPAVAKVIQGVTKKYSTCKLCP